MIDVEPKAEFMVSVAIAQTGDCLKNLGRLNEAVDAYQKSLRSAEKLENKRQISVVKFQLGTVLMLQQRYAEALEIFAEAQGIFETLGEPESIGISWHTIGTAHRHAGQFEQAEWAYRQSLAIWVQQKNLAGEASSLIELGNLYNMMGRFEEAVKCNRQATDISVKMQHQRHEGMARNNLANILMKLQRYDEARHELLLAIECDKPYGLAAKPWATWRNLYDLEQATGNLQAAAKARQQAVESYLAYRRAGGQSMTTIAQLCAQAIEQGDTIELAQQLTQFSMADAPPSFKLTISYLQTILRGERNSALIDDPNLDYGNAVELQLLLERLSSN